MTSGKINCSASRLAGRRLALQKTTQLSVIVSILSRRTFPEYGGRSRRFNSTTNQSINNINTHPNTLIIPLVETAAHYIIHHHMTQITLACSLFLHLLQNGLLALLLEGWHCEVLEITLVPVLHH